MENKKETSLITGFGISFFVVSIVNGLLVILKEENAGLKKWMAGLLGHHWVTHGVFIILLFFVLGWIFSRIKLDESWQEKKAAVLVLAGTIIGGGLIAVFPLLAS
jgi:hypothetical protein